MLPYSQANRAHFIESLKNETYDLLIIGGGITGCGIALDAALRGLKVALVEKNDFAFGTSSRSTKLIHGGLRYLKQLEFKLVHDVGSERAIVYRNARHLVIPEKMLLPIIKNGSLSKNATSLGLWVYDLLAGVKDAEKRIMLSAPKALKAEPLLNAQKVTGGGLYYEYRTDDARLVIELAKSAYKEGALPINYIECTDFLYEKNTINGIKAVDVLTNEAFEIKARNVVNAAGPFVDLLRKKNNSLFGKRLQLTKGVHLVFDYERLPIQQAVYFDTPDKRMIFAIPRDGITYVGTTDTLYTDSIDAPTISDKDIDYILAATNEMFPAAKLTKKDVVSGWAGLRPLIYEDGKSPSELSRKDEIIISESGLISIAGGKLTGYRLMAKKIVDLVGKNLLSYQKHVGDCKTKNYRLSGGELESRQEALDFIQKLTINHPQISTTQLTKWFYRYGKNTTEVIAHFQQTNDVVLAELAYCFENEMIANDVDFLVRRTGFLFFDIRQAKTATMPTHAFLQQKLPQSLLKFSIDEELSKVAVD